MLLRELRVPTLPCWALLHIPTLPWAPQRSSSPAGDTARLSPGFILALLPGTPEGRVG